MVTLPERAIASSPTIVRGLGAERSLRTRRDPVTMMASCAGAASVTSAASTLSVSTGAGSARSEEHTSELQSLMRISYAVFCLKKKTKQVHDKGTHTIN